MKDFTENYSVKIPILIVGFKADKPFLIKEPEKNEDIYGVKAIMWDNFYHDVMLDP